MFRMQAHNPLCLILLMHNRFWKTFYLEQPPLLYHCICIVLTFWWQWLERGSINQTINQRGEILLSLLLLSWKAVEIAEDRADQEVSYQYLLLPHLCSSTYDLKTNSYLISWSLPACYLSFHNLLAQINTCVLHPPRSLSTTCLHQQHSSIEIGDALLILIISSSRLIKKNIY